MRLLGRAALVCTGIILAVVLAGFLAERIFGGGEDATTEARDALATLPYPISTHPAPDGVLIGSVRAHQGVVVHFAISKGGPRSKGIPPRLVRADENLIDDGGFWVWDDSEVPSPGQTAGQFQEAGEVAVAIEEALCRKGTGKPCEI